MTQFKKATKKAVKLRAAIDGPTGAGKTLTALKIARGLVGPDGTIAVIDTEHGTSEKFYANHTDFDMAPLTRYQPKDYVALINAAKGYDCLIIDSLSHAWEGVLGMVDAKGGQFGAWRDVTPHHQSLVQALLTYPGHLIVTMRTKMAYEVSKNSEGRTEVVKLGLKPVQREGLEYEFDLVMDMDQAHNLTVSKSRMSDLADRTITMPGEDFGREIAVCVSDGEPVPEPFDHDAEWQRMVEFCGDESTAKGFVGMVGLRSRSELADESKRDAVWALMTEAKADVIDAAQEDAEDGVHPDQVTMDVEAAA